MSRELTSDATVAGTLVLPERFACISISFVSMLGVGLVTPILPYFSHHFGVSTLWGGILVGIFPLCEAASAPFLGRLGDHGHARIGLSSAFLIAAASYLVFAVADSFWVLIVARALAGAASGAVSIAQGYVGRRVSPERRAATLGQFGAAQSLGFVTGLAIGAVVGASPAGVPNYPYSFYFAAVLAAGAALAAFLSLRKVTGGAERTSLELPPGALVPLFLFGAKSVIFIGLTTLVPYVLQLRYGYSVRTTSLVFLAIALGAGFVQGVCVPYAAKAFSARWGTVLGFLFLAAGAGSGAFFALDPMFFWFAIAGLTIGYAFLIPFQLSDLTKRFGLQRTGYAMGLAVVAASSGATVGPVATGSLASAASFELAFVFCAGLGLLSVALTLGARE